RHEEKRLEYEGHLMQQVLGGALESDSDVTAESFVKSHGMRGLEIRNNDYDDDFYGAYLEELLHIQGDPSSRDSLWLARNFVTPNEFALAYYGERREIESESES